MIWRTLNFDFSVLQGHSWELEVQESVDNTTHSCLHQHNLSASQVWNPIPNTPWTWVSFDVSRPRVDPSIILRRVIINLDAIHEFVRAAESKLKDNVEMMGILLARAERVGDVTVFIQNTILIPEQSGTSDSCTMIGEEDLLNFTSQLSSLPLHSGLFHSMDVSEAFWGIRGCCLLSEIQPKRWSFQAHQRRDCLHGDQTWHQEALCNWWKRSGVLRVQPCGVQQGTFWGREHFQIQKLNITSQTNYRGLLYKICSFFSSISLEIPYHLIQVSFSPLKLTC